MRRINKSAPVQKYFWGIKTHLFMSAIIILLIVSLLVAGSFLAAFIWGVKHQQFDDDYAPPLRILFDDKPTEIHSEKSQDL
jgi:cbb3-type cytochrome oxidase maturation protein